MFVDSDDYLLPNSVRLFFHEMKKYQTIDIVIGNHFDEERHTNHFPSLTENFFLSNNKDILKNVYEDRLGFYAWNKIVRRSLIVNNNISFIEGVFLENRDYLDGHQSFQILCIWYIWIENNCRV